MPVVVSLLRGVNVGGHNKVKMDALRSLYESLGMRDVETYIQSGNIIFRCETRSLTALAKKIENAIEKRFGFRPIAILRTPSDLRSVIGKNPFARRQGIDPGKLIVAFMAGDPGADARQRIAEFKTDPEEMRVSARELYIYFPIGMGRSKLPLKKIEGILNTPMTARNWNSIHQILGMAEKLEASRNSQR